MPREIKFRGKRIDDGTGAWVYGGIDLMSGYTTIFDHSDMLHSQIDVDEDTVGQYTGLKDKNGKEIFEGDLLQGIDKLYQVTWDDEKAGYYITVIKTDYALSRGLSFPMYHWGVNGILVNCEILGDIYENPELLEG